MSALAVVAITGALSSVILSTGVYYLLVAVDDLRSDVAALWREVEDLHDRREVPLRRGPVRFPDHLRPRQYPDLWEFPLQRRPDGDAS